MAFPSGSKLCAAWLYTPTAVTSRGSSDSTQARPIIVMAHGLAGVKEERLDAFAERFATAGYACLVFDYRHFGDSEGEPRQLLDIDSQREDWRAAVTFARSLPDVDAERVVVWGTSFGGGHVIVTAAEDARIAAAISQCPFTDGLASGFAMSPATSAKVTALGIRDVLAARLGHAPVLVPSAGAPHTAALMTTPDALAGVSALMPAGASYSKDVAARIALQIPLNLPGRRAKDVSCPIFFAICERDTVAPAGPTQKYAAQAPHGEIKLYDAGHFDIYVGDWFERNVADQLDFLARHVPAI
ncbi:alpha/beta hydrolase [Nocardioides sp. Kera G14]|uniref:alpha/beta hydrolase n=1 Tax=Nocardioides sp. Kera G14 TaxID=2884264 RepID=UPI001D11149E|nr:alpha/beta hydrolase [Nocardioides sp. Kera G14]UDY23545.1 alpha/beta hydrolase [Nocardioides sp. Kera G14]